MPRRGVTLFDPEEVPETTAPKAKEPALPKNWRPWGRTPGEFLMDCKDGSVLGIMNTGRVVVVKPPREKG